MKTFFIIPGFKQKVNDKSFVWLKDFLTKKGFRVVMVPVKWNRTTLTDCAVLFEDFFDENRGAENYVLGFSYGAIIALMTAEKLQPKKLFLCSLSSDFKEDVPSMSDAIKRYIGKRRVDDCLTRSGKDIAKKLSIPTVIFYGDKEGIEYPQLKKRCEETARLSARTKIVIVKNSPHDISFPSYKKAICDYV